MGPGRGGELLTDQEVLVVFVVDATEHAQRLDRVVGARLPSVSRRELRALFSAGLVRCDGDAATKGQPARRDARVRVLVPAPRPPTESPPALRVVYDSPQVLVLDKPPGLPSTPLSTSEHTSLADLVLRAFPETRGIGFRPEEAGLLSRLDTATSGLVVCARTREAFSELRRGSTNARLVKQYQALVDPHCDLTPSEITLPLGPRRGNTRRVATGDAVRGKAVAACTRVLSLERGSSASLLLLEVDKAYRHQIRAHLAFAGWPIQGDVLYGGRSVNALERHALHAHRVVWTGSPDVPAFDVSAPLPDDLERVFRGPRASGASR